MKLRLFVLLVLTSSLPSCSNRGDQQAGGRSIADSSGGTVALGIGSPRSYQPTSATGSGAIAGTISLSGTPRDSIVAVGKDSKLCGDSANVADMSSVANTLVWIDGISTGKPLPDARRETLTIENCQIDPRVTAVVTKSTINIFSRDRVAHGPRFYREGASEPIASLHTVDAGQVVPSEKIASAPGIVEVRCDEHPFVRAYVAVFDHPYFAVTDEKGAFKIDGLPPGTYTVKLWHEGLAKPAAQRVVVGPNGTSRLDVALTLDAGTAAPSTVGR
jgi:hypothetical protein